MIIENVVFSSEEQIGLKVQLVLLNGFHMKIESIEPILIPVSEIVSPTEILKE